MLLLSVGVDTLLLPVRQVLIASAPGGGLWLTFEVLVELGGIGSRIMPWS